MILRTVAGSPPRAPACAASISIPGSWATSLSAPTANRSGVSPTSPTSSEMSCFVVGVSRRHRVVHGVFSRFADPLIARLSRVTDDVNRQRGGPKHRPRRFRSDRRSSDLAFRRQASWRTPSAPPARGATPTASTLPDTPPRPTGTKSGLMAGGSQAPGLILAAKSSAAPKPAMGVRTATA